MAELSNAKVFGGIGAILMLVGAFIPTGLIVSINNVQKKFQLSSSIS